MKVLATALGAAAMAVLVSGCVDGRYGYGYNGYSGSRNYDSSRYYDRDRDRDCRYDSSGRRHCDSH